MHGKWILNLAYNQRHLFNEIAEENLQTKKEMPDNFGKFRISITFIISFLT